MASQHGLREDKAPVGGPNVVTESVIVHDSTSLRKYKCKICDRKFNSYQAYGGHMKFHSIERKKRLQSWSSQLARHPMIMNPGTNIPTGAKMDESTEVLSQVEKVIMVYLLLEIRDQ